MLVDTNVLSDFFVGDPDALEAFQRCSLLAISPVVLGEVLAGFAVGSREGANRRLLSRFLAGPRVMTLTLGPDTAEHYAAVYRSLKKKGRPIPTNDLWIAASALEHGLTLLTRDSHYRHIEGLLTAASTDELLP